jgi:hypothetical protein
LDSLASALSGPTLVRGRHNGGLWYKRCAFLCRRGSDAAKKLGIFKSPQRLEDHLGKGGQLCCEAGDYIETIVVKHDKYVCQLTFKSHLGRTLTVGGRDKDGRTETTIGGPNMGWLGFQLKSGSWVDRMTFLMESTI